MKDIDVAVNKGGYRKLAFVSVEDCSIGDVYELLSSLVCKSFEYASFTSWFENGKVKRWCLEGFQYSHI